MLIVTHVLQEGVSLYANYFFEAVTALGLPDLTLLRYYVYQCVDSLLFEI